MSEPVKAESFGFNALSCAVDFDVAGGPVGHYLADVAKVAGFLAVALSPYSTPPAGLGLGWLPFVWVASDVVDQFVYSAYAMRIGLTKNRL